MGGKQKKKESLKAHWNWRGESYNEEKKVVKYTLKYRTVTNDSRISVA